MAKIIENIDKPTVREYFLNTNKFTRPEVWSDEDATFILLSRLILLNPGTYPDHPEMGVGLVEKYRYANARTILPELIDNIRDQINTYLPEFSTVNVEISVGVDKELKIDVVLDSVLYSMTYDPDTYKLSDVK